MATSEKQAAARNKYDAKTYKYYPIKFKIEEFEELSDYCASKGVSLNGFAREILMKAIHDEKI